MFRLCLLISVLLTASCRGPIPEGAIRIIDKPIEFSQKRIAATLRYLKEHYGIIESGIEIIPRIIIIHWTGANTLEDSWKIFDPELLGEGRVDISGGGALNVSAHFIVDRDGLIYRLMPETWMARHVIGLNYSAIAIENVGGVGGTSNLNRAQYEANARLVRDLKFRFPTIRFLAGHKDYRDFEGHPLWLELDPNYRTRKIDPGEEFVIRVRSLVLGLGLEESPH